MNTRRCKRFYLLVSVMFLLGGLPRAAAADDTSALSAPEIVLRLPPSESNPRNSEGDFIRLADGRLLFIYTHFEQGAKDNSPAFLASRSSSDGGKTWSRNDVLVVPNEAKENVMSVSLLRLQDGRIALLYLRKNSWTDCRPWLRFSADEGATWSDAVAVIPDSEKGYYVVNNDRLVQLASGRLVIPVAQHNGPQQDQYDPHATILCYLSDDAGRTWRRGRGSQDGTGAEGDRVMLQEPGVVELTDGRLLVFCRTNSGTQFVTYSDDGGETFPPLQASDLLSPQSPASIERIPSTGDLLLVWNDHRGVAHRKRTPLTAALSRDEGRTWQLRKTLYDDPNGWYCYTAIDFVDDAVLLGHCAGDRTQNNGLAESHITRVPLRWLYADPQQAE